MNNSKKSFFFSVKKCHSNPLNIQNVQNVENQFTQLKKWLLAVTNGTNFASNAVSFFSANYFFVSWKKWWFIFQIFLPQKKVSKNFCQKLCVIFFLNFHESKALVKMKVNKKLFVTRKQTIFTRTNQQKVWGPKKTQINFEV